MPTDPPDMQNTQQATDVEPSALPPSGIPVASRPSGFEVDDIGLPSWNALRKLLAAKQGPCARIFPIVEPGVVVFVWQGEAGGVSLRHFMSRDAVGFPFEREPGGNLWRLRLRVPDRARFEYKLDIDGYWIQDPLNPAQATDPFGANSVCETFGYSAPDWVVPKPGIQNGSLQETSVYSGAFGEHRRLGIYRPAGYRDDGNYPLVVIHDGFDYVDHAALLPILDNLITAGDLPPLVAALTHSPDRMVEYVDDPRHAEFVTRELLPAVESACAVTRSPRQRVLMGASLGAVASLSIAARAPQVFDGVVLKSGSFIFDPRLLETRARLFHGIMEFIDGLSHEERLMHRAFVCCGRFEGLVGENRRMAAFLRRAGVATRYVESRDAHHWHNWRDQVRAGLMWCLRHKYL
jgi:enterochelin esterase family protein